MPRSIRHEYPGAVYHAMSRGNNGQDIFSGDDGCRLFLATLEEACLQTGWIVHAYVLMWNHYHLLLETPEPNLVVGMKWFQGTYTQRFNAMFSRYGHLFQGRYKAVPVATDSDPSYFREVGQYIHLNPFHARLAGPGTSQPLERYEWSSYPVFAGTAMRCPDWLCRRRLLRACGLEEGAPGCAAGYKALIEARMKEPAPAMPNGIRERVEKQIKRGWYIGGEPFRKRLSAMIDGPSDNLRGSQRKAHNEEAAERLLEKALKQLKLSEAQLVEMKSTRLEKQAIAWLLKTRTTVSVQWLASRLGMGHRTNASRAISAFDKAPGKSARSLRTKMLQFTG